MFDTLPLREAQMNVTRIRRMFVDFNDFMDRHAKGHYLIMGAHQTAFDSCHKISICDHSHEPYPVHGLARPYLRSISSLQAAPEVRVYDYGLFEREGPAYCPGIAVGDFTYIDLDAAFWQIYRVASLDMIYDGTKWPRNGQIKFLGSEELRPHKLLRNSIVGTTRAEYRMVMDHGRVLKERVGTRWLRPDLWAYIMDVLDAVAFDVAVLFESVHIFVDGYIVPTGTAVDLRRYLQEFWHLDSSVRVSGPGRIAGLNNWEIADQSQGDVDPIVSPIGKEIKISEKNPWTELRSWFVDAYEYFVETPFISPKRLDGQLVPW